MSFGLMYESTIVRLSLISENPEHARNAIALLVDQEVGMKEIAGMFNIQQFCKLLEPKQTRSNGGSLCGWFPIAVEA